MPLVLFLSPTDAYPYRLQGHFMTRYPSQTITVENAGVPGEFATVGGLARLSPEINDRRPNVLLLMEGTNDLNGRSPDRVAQALDDMVRDARQRGVVVFIATLPPARPATRPTQAANIPILNGLIKQIPLKYGGQNVHLVDVYAPLAANMSLIGQDDLHPTPAGYEVMAQTWFNAIVSVLDPSVASAARSVRWK